MILNTEKSQGGGEWKDLQDDADVVVGSWLVFWGDQPPNLSAVLTYVLRIMEAERAWEDDSPLGALPGCCSCAAADLDDGKRRNPGCQVAQMRQQKFMLEMMGKLAVQAGPRLEIEVLLANGASFQKRCR